MENPATKKEVTRLMRRFEKLIAWYNKRDKFDTLNVGTPSEKKEYQMALNVWDQLKAKRDSISQ